MKTLYSLLLSLFLFLVPVLSPVPGSVYAKDIATQSATVEQQQQTDVIVFVREGCTHCQDEEAFFADLIKTRSDIRVTYRRLENPEDRQMWDEFTTRLGISKVTPITVIGETYVIGFDQPETTGIQLIALIDTAKAQGITTDLSGVRADSSTQPAATCPEDGSTPCVVEGVSPYLISVPFFGQLDARAYPLAALSAILGLLDGFNPCAMWVLVTFLIILLQVGNRRKMFLFAGIFVLAETIMYYLILTVWFRTWDFVQLDEIVTPIVGVVSIGAGIFFLREWRKKELECRVTNVEQRAKTRRKIEELAIAKLSLVTVLGILGLAFSVNIIEFACSIGIPQTFTKILEINNLGFWKSNLFILIYILFYMIDDFIVFGIALYGMDKLALTAKYSRFSNLIGGVIMIILGLILILRPSIFLF